MDDVFQLLDKIDDVDSRISLLEDSLQDLHSGRAQQVLRDYVKYENKQFSKYWADKNRYANLGDSMKQEECNRKLKKIKRFINVLKTLSHTNNTNENEKIVETIPEREPVQFVDSFRERILEFDEFCSTNIYAQLEHLENATDVSVLLESIKMECLKTHELIKSKLKIAKDVENSDDIQKIRRIRKTKTFILNYLNDSISKFNILEKIRQKKSPTYEEIFGKERTYSEEQCKIMADLIALKEPVVTSLTDLVIALKAVIQNYVFLEVYPSTQRVLNILDDAEITPALREIHYLSILDTLKHKKNSNLQRFQERLQLLLETVSGEQDNVQQNLKIQEKKQLVRDFKYENRLLFEMIASLENEVLLQNDSFFDYAQALDYQIMEYCIHRQIPYYYLKKILDNRPDLVYLEKDGESIVTMVLEKYIESQKIQLRNHHHDYIPKEYYKNFYQLLMDHAYRPFSSKVEKSVQELIQEFELYIKESGYTSEHKTEALSLFDEVVHKPQKIVSSSLTETDVEDISHNLKEYTSYLNRMKGRARLDSGYLDTLFEKISAYQNDFYDTYKDYPTPDAVCRDLKIEMYDYMNAVYAFSTVCFQNKHTSYSLLQDGKGSTLLRMNVFDLSSYIQEGDLLEKYLHENMHQNFSNPISYGKFSLVPSITYQVKIFPNGSTGSLKIYPSVARIQRRYDSLQNYRDDSILKSYVATYKKLTKRSDSPRSVFEMENAFKNFITNQVVSFCKYEDIPLILRGTKFADEFDLMFIQSDLGPTFSKMEREHFRFYSNIFRSCLDEAHYVNRDLESGAYSLKLEGANSYIDLFNQRMLLAYEKLLQNEEYRNSCWIDADTIVADANDSIGYVQDIKNEKTKKKSRRG